MQGLNGRASPQGAVRAYLAARRVAASLTGGISAGSPTPGNIYVSEDGGDRWHTVANNLPPIYSVRFG